MLKMETNTWKIEKHLCRCCHSEGSFKNLAVPCIEMGEEEIYCDMLKDCFDIDLTPVPGNLCAPTYTICTTCIHRLRDAATFKKQVVTCEKKFREMYNSNIIIAAAPPFLFDVKQEPDPSDEYIKYELMGIDSADSGDEKNSLDIKCSVSDQSDDEDDYKLSTLEGTKKKNKTTQKKQKSKKAQKKVKTKKEKPADDDDEANGDAAIGDDKKSKKKESQPRKEVVCWKRYYRYLGDALLCTQCGITIKDSSKMRTHMRAKHFPKFKCPCCEQVFHTPSPFVLHKLNEHNIDDRIKCQACDKKFTMKHMLTTHMKVYHKLGPRIQCEFCEYVGHSTVSMKRHLLKHKPLNLKCKYCNKVFKRRSNLRCHENIHTGNKNKVCSQCGQKFVQKASLNYHMAKYHPGVDF